MKKIICILLAFLLFPAGALAFDLSAINEYLVIFGEDELTEGKVSGDFTIYDSGSCQVLFSENQAGLSILVYDGGNNFLAICTAAVMSIESDNSGFMYNSGIILSNYLLACGSEEDKSTYTKDGNFIVFSNRDGKMVCAVTRR